MPVEKKVKKVKSPRVPAHVKTAVETFKDAWKELGVSAEKVDDEWTLRVDCLVIPDSRLIVVPKLEKKLPKLWKSLKVVPNRND